MVYPLDEQASRWLAAGIPFGTVQRSPGEGYSLGLHLLRPEIIDARSDCQKALTPTLTPIGAREQPKRQGKEGVAKS